MKDKAQSIIQKAIDCGFFIVAAESVTGGRIASRLTSVPGASKVFIIGVVAYSGEAKEKTLLVDHHEIEISGGGYSEKTVRCMAENLARAYDADFSVATSGCAGPDYSEGFDKGRVLISVYSKRSGTKVFDLRFEGTREEVQDKAAESALQKLLEEMH